MLRDAKAAGTVASKTTFKGNQYSGESEDTTHQKPATLSEIGITATPNHGPLIYCLDRYPLTGRITETPYHCVLKTE